MPQKSHSNAVKPINTTNPQATYAEHTLKDLKGYSADADKKHTTQNHEEQLLNLLGREARGERRA